MMSSSTDLPWYRKARAWAQKRRYAIIFWAAAATGTGVCAYYAASWFRSKMKEREEHAAAQLAIRRKEADERVDAQLHHHFETIQTISDSTTLPFMLAPLRERLFGLLDLSATTNRLTAGKQTPQNPQGLSSQERLQLWNKLKVLSFTRTASAMVALTLLDLLVRVQMNIIGRRMYIDSVREQSASGERDLYGSYTSNWQQRFLAFAEFLPRYGLNHLVEGMQISVEGIVAGIPLTQPLDSYELKDLLARILADFLNQQLEWEKYLLPSEDILTDELEAAVTEADHTSLGERRISAKELQDFKMLMAETRAVLSSVEFQSAIETVLDVVFTQAMAKYWESVSEDVTGGVPLARLILPVSNLSDTFLEHPSNNIFVTAVARNPEVRAFCAMVYASSTPGN